MTREFYKKEAMTFRAIIKTLLGWHIQIDLGHMMYNFEKKFIVLMQ
jgi:hypothetical protein